MINGSAILKAAVNDVISIGKQITDLSQQSKDLRGLIANRVEQLGLGVVNEDVPVEFRMDDVIVSVKKARGTKDFTVLCKELKSI